SITLSLHVALPISYPPLEIVEGVSMLAEHDQLAPDPSGPGHLLAQEDRPELFPLLVRTRGTDRLGELLQRLELGDLGTHLLDRLRRRRLVDGIVLELLQLLVGVLVEVEVIQRIENGNACRRGGGQRATSGQLVQASLETLASSLQRPIDRL